MWPFVRRAVHLKSQMGETEEAPSHMRPISAPVCHVGRMTQGEMCVEAGLIDVNLLE